MQVTLKIAMIALVTFPAIAGDKKQPPARSLAEDAAYLTQKSGPLGWTTDDLWLATDQGKVKFKGQLWIAFGVNAGKAKDGLALSVRSGRNFVGDSLGAPFELVEEKGKRSIVFRRDKDQYKLEYTIDGDTLHIKGPSNVQWALNPPWFADFTKGTPFRAGKAASRLSVDEQAAVAAIKNTNNIATVDDTRPSGPVATVRIISRPIMNALEHAKKFKSVKTLDLYLGVESKDALLKELLKEAKDLPGLEELDLATAEYTTDAGLKELKEFKNLRRLAINGNDRITNAGLKELSHLTELRVLIFERCQLTDDGLKELRHFPELHFLNIHGTKVTDAGLKQLKDLPKLQELFIGETKVTDAGVKELQKARPDLKIHR